MKALLLVVAALLCPAAQADYLPFSATMAGDSNIVEIIDPSVPVVRLQTVAAGSGSLGLVGYSSGDIVNLATGAGAGSNRFIDADGDELFGTFTVQLIPTADPATLELIGEMLFTGGTGSFFGATGSASFFGSGTFDSATHALSRFVFDGRLALVPEPMTLLLLIVPMGMLLARSRRPTRPQRSPLE